MRGALSAHRAATGERTTAEERLEECRADLAAASERRAQRTAQYEQAARPRPSGCASGPGSARCSPSTRTVEELAARATDEPEVLALTDAAVRAVDHALTAAETTAVSRRAALPAARRAGRRGRGTGADSRTAASSAAVPYGRPFPADGRPPVEAGGLPRRGAARHARGGRGRAGGEWSAGRLGRPVRRCVRPRPRHLRRGRLVGARSGPVPGRGAAAGAGGAGRGGTHRPVAVRHRVRRHPAAGARRRGRRGRRPGGWRV